MVQSSGTPDDQEQQRYYQQERGNESIWSEIPAQVRPRKGSSVLFSLRLPAAELELLRQEAERRDTTVSTLLREGAKLLVRDQGSGESIRIPADLYRRVAAIRPMIEATIEESQGIGECLNLIIELGLARALADIVGAADAPTLVQAMVQLAARAPEAVYDYTADMLKLGAEVNAPRDEAPSPEDGTKDQPESRPTHQNVVAFEAKVKERAARLAPARDA